MKVSWAHLTPAPCEMFYMETVGIFWQDDLSKQYPQKSLKLWKFQTFLWTQAALTQHNAAQRAREQLTILAGPGPESQEKEWLGTNGKAGDCWIFQGTWVFVGFSLVVANFCRTRRKMALHGLMGEYNFARTVWGMDFLLWGRAMYFFGGKFGPSITVWEGKILWEDVLCFTGWPERPLKVIAAIARILDKWWFLQRSDTPQLLKGMDVDVDQHWESEDRMKTFMYSCLHKIIQPYQTLSGKPAEVVRNGKQL